MEDRILLKTFTPAIKHNTYYNLDSVAAALLCRMEVISATVEQRDKLDTGEGPGDSALIGGGGSTITTSTSILDNMSDGLILAWSTMYVATDYDPFTLQKNLHFQPPGGSY